MESYFTIIKQTEEEGKINNLIEINANHSVYTGHFPEQPIMPGVVQLQIVTELLNSVLKEGLLLREALNFKFLSIIEPQKVKTMDVEISYKKNDKNGYDVTAVGSDETTKYFRLNGLFEKY